MKTITETCDNLGLKACNVRHWQLAAQINYASSLEILDAYWYGGKVFHPGDTVQCNNEIFEVDEIFAVVEGIADVGQGFVYANGNTYPIEDCKKLLNWDRLGFSPDYKKISSHVIVSQMDWYPHILN